MLDAVLAFWDKRRGQGLTILGWAIVDSIDASSPRGAGFQRFAWEQCSRSTASGWLPLAVRAKQDACGASLIWAGPCSCVALLRAGFVLLRRLLSARSPAPLPLGREGEQYPPPDSDPESPPDTPQILHTGSASLRPDAPLLFGLSLSTDVFIGRPAYTCSIVVMVLLHGYCLL